MAIVLVRGNPSSLPFRRRLVDALARSVPLEESSGVDSLEGEIKTKYYTCKLRFTVETDEEPEGIIAVHDGSDLESLLDAPNNDMVKLLVTFEEDNVHSFPSLSQEEENVVFDREFEKVVWDSETASCSSQLIGLPRLREALQCHVWSNAIMSSPTKPLSSPTPSSSSTVLIHGGPQSIQFRRCLCEALSSNVFPSTAHRDCVPGVITTKYYTAKVVYCVEADDAPEAIIAVYDGSDISDLLQGHASTKLCLTCSEEEENDISSLRSVTPTLFEECTNRGFEHVIWSPDQGFTRLKQALECTMWSSSDTIRLEEAKTKPSRREMSDEMLEEVLGNFDALADKIRDARKFAARTDITDDERRKHAADVAFQLLADIDDSDSSDGS